MQSRAVAAMWLAAIIAGPMLGQSTPAQPAFDAADVHVSPPGTENMGTPIHGGRIEWRGLTMLRLVSLAYNVEVEKVTGGPSWLDTDMFDIIAKSPAATTSDQVRDMLKSLLAERFNLVVHSAEKPMPVFVMTVSKRGLQMKESTGEGDPDCKGNNQPGYQSISCQHLSMTDIAGRLRMSAAAYFNHEVIDQTGLKGKYDFSLKWTARGLLGAAGPDGDKGISAFDAVDKQLGLKVEQQNLPAKVIVVDSVNRKPSPNPPDVLEKLPPPPTEFEVADIRPSRPGGGENFNMRNGRIEATGITMKDFISVALNFDNDRIISGEKWLDTDHFDIVAKSQPDISIDALRVMVRKLLEDRFKLKAHEEKQPVPVYALTAPKKNAKLKEADPSERTECKISVADGIRSYTCTNITMAQFADKLQGVARGYLDHPVVDLTELPGAYDFVVSWSPVGRVMGRGGRGEAGADSARDPSNGLTVFEGIEKLGLKLSPQKHPMPVLVIDHINRTPTEN